MLENVANALQRQDYETAASLLKTLPADDPWSMLYSGQLQEAIDQPEAAAETYRQLLRADCGRKIASEARQGLERLKAVSAKTSALAARVSPIVGYQAAETQIDGFPTSSPLSSFASEAGTGEPTELAMLVLESVATEVKTQLAQQFAQVMHVEPYAARLLLPSRGWRLYRANVLAEIQTWGKDLQAVGIPLFWLPLSRVQQLQVQEVRYFETAQPQATAFCISGDPHEEPQAFTFDWSEVNQRVEGAIPVFEQVVDRDSRGKMLRKEQVQDHVQFCDLHLPQRNTILRIYSGVYQFNKGLALVADATTPTPQSRLAGGTTWANWQRLQGFLAEVLPDTPVWNDFTSFAETAVDHPDLLEHIHPHIHLFRREESLWDQAFHLYSSLIFWRMK
jgi:hypothetical protein